MNSFKYLEDIINNNDENYIINEIYLKIGYTKIKNEKNIED